MRKINSSVFSDRRRASRFKVSRKKTLAEDGQQPPLPARG